MPFLDIYDRTPEDINFNDTKLEESDEIESLIQQLKCVLITRKGEVLGEPNFGASLLDYVFSSNLSIENLKKEIQTQITTYIPLSTRYPVSVDVGYVRGNNSQDSVFIDVSVKDNKVFGVLVGT